MAFVAFSMLFSFFAGIFWAFSGFYARESPVEKNERYSRFAALLGAAMLLAAIAFCVGGRVAGYIINRQAPF